MQVRCRQFELEGAKFVHGALTKRQVTDIFGEGKTASLVDLCCRALNNAREMQPEAARGAEWTLERLNDETDAQAFDALCLDVAKFNKIELRKQAGEAPAAE